MSTLPARSIVLNGGCQCGAIRYEVSGQPIFASQCHCRDCQRASGSACVATVRMPVAGFRITRGTPKRYVSRADSGNEVIRAFCGDCGSPLYSQVSARPDRIGIRATSLDDPSWFHAEADIFVKSAQPWDHMDPAIPKYASYPPGQSNTDPARD